MDRIQHDQLELNSRTRSDCIQESGLHTDTQSTLLSTTIVDPGDVDASTSTSRKRVEWKTNAFELGELSSYNEMNPMSLNRL